MRERRSSYSRTAIAKLRREGLLSLLFQAPVWWLRTTYRGGRLELLRRYRRLRYRRQGMRAIPDPEATIDVDPATVTHLVPLSRFDGAAPRTLLGTVRGGDWDRGLPRIEPRPKYQACRARVEDGTPWVETGIVDHLAAELAASDADTIEHGCGSRAALRERYESTRETLYLSLRDEGYDSEQSPVCCRLHIGRDGRLLFGSGGRHRFYLSRLLGIDSVPVRLLCRHPEWQAVRETVAAAEHVDALPDAVRRQLDHPDLQEFAIAREASESTWRPTTG